MEADRSTEILVLIYEASCCLIPSLCNFLLKETESKTYRIRFNFLETNEDKYDIATNHCSTVRNFRSRVLTDVVLTKQPKLAFKNIDYAILLPSNIFDRGIEHSEIYDGRLFIYIGRALEQYAKRSVQVIIFGLNHVNVLCSVCSHFCPSINPCQITGVSCHHELRAKHILAEKTGHSPSRIRDVYVWGTDRVDVQNACLEDVHDPTTDVQGNLCAVHTIDFDSCDEVDDYSLFSQNSHTTQILRNINPARTELLKCTSYPKENAWKKECDMDPGFHCMDVVAVDNIFECYAYALWDINYPEVNYKTKYWVPNVTKEDIGEESRRRTSEVKGKRKCHGEEDQEISTKCSNLEEKCKKLSDVIQDDAWIKSNLVDKIKELDSTVDLLTISYAICRHFNHLVYGSVEPLSMVVNSDGSYGVHKSVFFSFPVNVVEDKIVIVRGICMESNTNRYIHTKSSAFMRFSEKLADMPAITHEIKLVDLISSLTQDGKSQEDLPSSQSSSYSYISGTMRNQ